MKDAGAHTKFMYWLKKNIGRVEITELSASARLEGLRAEQEHFLGPSFGPISAYGEHGAIVHYSADEKSNVPLKEGKLFMTDTGGHYLKGRTDITRTVALGEVGNLEKETFHTGCKSNATPGEHCISLRMQWCESGLYCKRDLLERRTEL